MRVVIQRSLKSSVIINHKLYNEIEHGLVIFAGFETNDSYEDIEYIVKKIIGLRIFDDENGIMNKNIIEVQGEILSISQSTLHACTKKGNRPSYQNAMNKKDAITLYEAFNESLNKYVPTKSGKFGAEMQVNINNDGPITICIDSKNK